MERWVLGLVVDQHYRDVWLEKKTKLVPDLMLKRTARGRCQYRHYRNDMDHSQAGEPRRCCPRGGKPLPQQQQPEMMYFFVSINLYVVFCNNFFKRAWYNGCVHLNNGHACKNDPAWLVHVKCMHELWSLLTHILTYLQYIWCYIHVLY
jgi:hypothetical protein